MDVFPRPHRVKPERDPALARIRRGVYADATALADAERRERHLARMRAVAMVRREPVFALLSALTAHAIPFPGEAELVHTIGGSATSGRRAGVAHTHVEIDPGDVVVVDGLLACSPAYALAHVARRCSQMTAVSALDAAVRAGIVTKEEVEDALERQGPRGRARARWAIAFADARSESVGESCSRVTIHRLGAPAPELQWRIPTPDGDRWGDFRWERPGRRPLIGEFDGEVKYRALAEERGEDAAGTVVREKRREDGIRLSHDVARWVWLDAMRHERLRRILAAVGLPLAPTTLPGW